MVSVSSHSSSRTVIRVSQSPRTEYRSEHALSNSLERPIKACINTPSMNFLRSKEKSFMGFSASRRGFVLGSAVDRQLAQSIFTSSASMKFKLHWALISAKLMTADRARALSYAVMQSTSWLIAPTKEPDSSSLYIAPEDHDLKAPVMAWMASAHNDTRSHWPSQAAATMLKATTLWPSVVAFGIPSAKRLDKPESNSSRHCSSISPLATNLLKSAVRAIPKQPCSKASPTLRRTPVPSK